MAARKSPEGSERGSEAVASVVSYPVARCSASAAAVGGAGRGHGRGALLGAAQLEDRLQPEGRLLHERTIRCSQAHASGVGVDSPIGCCRNASICGARSRARSTSGSLPGW